jgi:pimeloyl-ACP methyl ester carboxylesterase
MELKSATICCSLSAPTTRAEARPGVAENCSAAVRKSTPCRRLAQPFAFFNDRLRDLVVFLAVIVTLTAADEPGVERRTHHERNPLGACGRENIVECVLTINQRILRGKQADYYRAPFAELGASLPTIIWPREIVFEGEPEDNYRIVKQYSDWLAGSAGVPKLFMNADQGHGTAGAAREFCRKWSNQREITLPAKHYVPEDCPHQIGEAVASFISDVRSKRPMVA